MPFKTGNTPWNKGLQGDPRNGWTDERRAEMSRRMTEKYKDMGEQPHRWLFPAHLREHRRRFLRARCQAKYWCQAWTITWDQYVKLYDQCEGTWGRNNQKHNHSRDTHINLVRINTQQGWHLANVKLMERDTAMRRPRPRDKNGNYIRRKRRNADADSN